ncbi:organic cation transporter protein-like [Saccostrea echinata]|uniref:organic cation transporter protein-like n=1 Tax=Saccostrea echinata TaxID=191078 RepID=UPI002A7F9380|nr:organic cation transporter protein-like [Saccostrea echinata]
MDFDDILKKIGEFGPYQKRTLALLSITWIIISPVMIYSVFGVATPDHRCGIPDFDNDTYRVQNSQHQELIQKYIPIGPDGLYDKCHMYRFNQSTRSVLNDSGTLEECSSWVFDKTLFDETIVTKMNLVCKEKYKASLSKTIFFGGVLVGSFLFGLLSDVLGRRFALLIALLIVFASNMAMAWAGNFATFVILYMCAGAGVVGIFMTSYVLGMEWVGFSKRIFAGCVVPLIGPLGEMYLILISYLTRTWHWMAIFSAIPFGLYIILWWFIPESPRWLCGKNRKKDAAILLKKAAEWNHTEFSPEILDNIAPKEKEAGKVWLLFSDRKLGLRTAIIFYNWLAVCMVFYGLDLNTAMLYGNFYINFLIFVLLEFTGNILPLFTINRFGRKRSYVFYTTVGGLSCLSTILTVNYLGKDLQILTTVLAMIGMLFNTAGFATLYIFSAEIFPTVVRNVGMGTSSSWARVGAMISPFIAETRHLVYGSTGVAIPLVIFGGACLIGAGLSLFVPDTRNKMMPETIEDGKNFTMKIVLGKKKNMQDNEENATTNF